MGNVGTHLAAENQLLITSAEAMDQSRSKNSSSGWNAGLAIEFGQGGTSMGVTVGANLGKGHANADSLSHRHSHIGSLGSLTSLSVGGSTTLAGAQVFGEEVHVKTPNLIIQSVQDTATYEGKQQEMGGQITVGYGVSGSANFSRSSINADYASVTEQSGIYAGDGGYQIEVAEHTELIGGLITSTAAAEAAGNNRFSTGTLSASDLANHAEFEGSSIGIGASGGFNSSGSGDGVLNQRQSTSDKSGLASMEASGSIGFGQESDNEGSTVMTQHFLLTLCR